MALVVSLRFVEGLEGNSDRLAKVTFRGHTKTTKPVKCTRGHAYFGESFEWPLARLAEGSEALYITLHNYSKYFKTQKQTGALTMHMEGLIQEGKLKIHDNLIDSNNRALNAMLCMEIQYYSPDGTVGTWTQEEFVNPLIDPDPPPPPSQRIIDGDIDELDNKSFSGSGRSLGTINLDETDGSITTELPDFDEMPELLGEESKSQAAMVDTFAGSQKQKPQMSEQEMHKPKDFKVCITIIEGLQLTGLNIDPCVQIKVGGKKKYTSIKQSTNNPFYDDYFVFDFSESPAMLFDKLIQITAMHSLAVPGRELFRVGNMLAGRAIGTYKCDIGTVYSQPDHQYYHKWAVLIDPKEMGDGIKGYIKCDIAVLGPGDAPKKHKQLKDEEAENVEGNLLLPKGVPMERQRAEYKIIIYRAEDLPQTDFGIMASLRKAISSSSVALIDAFVKVSFLGHVSKTSVRKNYNPEWCEIIKIIDLFPPLCNRFKIQLCDSDMTSDDPIGTHFIELGQIMDPGGDAEGIEPSFGPTWVNFYGSPQNYSFIGEHEELDQGLGEGAAYKGRLLMAIRTEILDGESSGPAKVERTKLRSTAKIETAPRKEFFLFATIFEANMINKELKDKKIFFELSIGHFGNTIDARRSRQKERNESSDSGSSDESEDEFGKEDSLLVKKKLEEETGLPCNSESDPMLPAGVDDDKEKKKKKNYYYLPYGERKPCLYAISIFEDSKRRIFHVNLMERITEAFESGLEDVRQMLRLEHDASHRRLRGVLDEFVENCEDYLKHANTLKMGSGLGKTKLDKYRIKMCRTQIDKIKSKAAELRRRVTRDNVEGRYREARDTARRIKHLAKEPQISIPDVFIWMVNSDKQRIAYCRFPAKDIMYSTQEEFRGKHCMKVQTVFLKKPGKKQMGMSGWEMQAKLEVYLYLGLRNPTKTIKEHIEGLPKGYDIPEEFEDSSLPPEYVIYPEKNTFKLRATLFSARGLIGSDDSGLSDPFARVIISNQCKQTQVQYKTLCPHWDETLEFEGVTFYGPIEQIVETPPLVIIEIFDYDLVGDPEFLGRVTVRPKVKTSKMRYVPPDFPPALEWFDVYRGPQQAGELLGAFEFLQPDEVPTSSLEGSFGNGVDGSVKGSIRESHASSIKAMPVIDIPPVVKPTVSKYKFEVLFWGVRDMKRIQLMNVKRPRCDFVVGGERPICSDTIADISINSNFEKNVHSQLVLLPDNELYWPPITIRVVDARNYGQEVLAGTATITKIQKYMWESEEEIQKREEEIHAKKERLRLAAEELMMKQQKMVQDAKNEANKKRNTLSKMKGKDKNGNDIEAQQENEEAIVPADVIINMEPESNKGRRLEPLPEKDAETKEKERMQMREMTDECDWWSKYYVTMEDLSKADQIKAEQNPHLKALGVDFDSDMLDSDSDGGYDLNAVDYEDLNQDALNELQKEADERRKAAEMVNPKKRKKFRPKKMAKKLKKLKGRVNKGFKPEDFEGEGGEGEEDYVDENEDKSHIQRIEVYRNSLESAPKFGGFQDLFETISLFRGKNLDDDDSNEDARLSGKLKFNCCIYKLQLDEDGDPLEEKENKLAKWLPSFKPRPVQVTVRIIECKNLNPVDLNGLADPYLVLRLGRKEINDKENKQFNTLNPVFGKQYDFDVVFPLDSMLNIQVMDYDRFSADDLIGETTIDLENRFHSKHRATCGIASKYEMFGYNQWRDPEKPTQILDRLCKKMGILPPVYKVGSVKLEGITFYAPSEIEAENGDILPTNEHLALEVLRHWDEVPKGCHLVPEHVETRPIYNPETPNVEQGRIVMWVDMFPTDMPTPTVQVDITPRKPKSYELRCIIWNTDEVALEDENVLTGEQSSDICVRGFLKGKEIDQQSTDVHYRSLTGEGNFNWRMVWKFDYLQAEEKIVFKKSSTFDVGDTEVKVPCKLTLQVWDADLVSADDFLGDVQLDLSRMPRPARDMKNCRIEMLDKKMKVPTLNLFKQKRCKGWWPFQAEDEEEGGMKLMGKVEAEMHLLDLDEAEKEPVGLARSDPQPLAEPKRPDASSFFRIFSHTSAIFYILLKGYKWILIKAIIITVLIVFLVLLFYNLPGATVSKIFGN